jgi:hypothetical protein
MKGTWSSQNVIFSSSAIALEFSDLWLAMDSQKQPRINMKKLPQRLDLSVAELNLI